MNGLARIGGDDMVHEVEELDPPAPLLMRCGHFARSHVEGGEQRRSAVAHVVVAVAGQRPTVRQLQVALRPLQGWIEGFSSTQITIAFSGGAM